MAKPRIFTTEARRTRSSEARIAVDPVADRVEYLRLGSSVGHPVSDRVYSLRLLFSELCALCVSVVIWIGIGPRVLRASVVNHHSAGSNSIGFTPAWRAEMMSTVE